MTANRFRAYVPLATAAVIVLNGIVQVLGGIAQVLDLGHYLQLGDDVAYLDVAPGLQTEGLVLVALGTILLVLGKGLAERRRRSLIAAVVVLTLLIAGGLWQGATLRTTALPAALLLLLVLVRDQFEFRPDRRKLTYAEIVAACSVVLALAFGVVGSYLLRRDFNGIETWTDAVYFTVVVFSTLGFGDILPTTANAKIFTILMVVIGLASFATALTVLAGPYIEERMKGVVSVMSKFAKTVNHVVICGSGNVADSIIDELRDQGVPFLIIEADDEVAAWLEGRGLDVLVGDATATATLQAANLVHASAVIAATDSDAQNSLIAITARELREKDELIDFRIIVRIESEENMEKVRGLGIDEVISPSTLGGRMMATRALNPDAA